LTRCFDGQLLRDARVAAHVRPEQLALAVDRSVVTLHAYERGEVHPPVNVLAQIADELGGSVDDFLRELAPGPVQQVTVTRPGRLLSGQEVTP